MFMKPGTGNRIEIIYTKPNFYLVGLYEDGHIVDSARHRGLLKALAWIKAKEEQAKK